MKTTVGQVVFSKCGRDKGRPLAVVSVGSDRANRSAQDADYVFLADGNLRPIQKPKRKKLKHVQPTHTLLPLCGSTTDAELRRWLKPFNVSAGEEVCNAQG